MMGTRAIRLAERAARRDMYALFFAKKTFSERTKVEDLVQEMKELIEGPA